MSKMTWFLMGQVFGTVLIVGLNFFTGLKWVDARNGILQDGYNGRIYGVIPVERQYIVKDGARIRTHGRVIWPQATKKRLPKNIEEL